MVARNTYVKTSAGWEQIATTIQAIPQGLVPIVPTSVTNGSTTGDGQITFTAQTSVSLNGVFNATFDSYLVLFDVSTAAGNTAVSLRLRAAGVDNVTAGSYLMALSGITTGAVASNITTAASSATFMYLPSAYPYGSASITMLNPFLAVQTKANLTASGTDSAYGSFAGRSGSIGHTQATSYDGLTFITTAAITGTVRVYGYSKGGLSQPQTVQPYSVAAGSISLNGNNTRSRSATVTFPTGRFTVAPGVTLGSGEGFLSPSVTSITSTGATITLTHLDASNWSATYPVYWVATQMTSASAGG